MSNSSDTAIKGQDIYKTRVDSRKSKAEHKIPGSIPVLMYRRVINNKVTAKDNWICVHKTNFEKQLRLLELWGYTTITFSDYDLYLQGRFSMPRKPIIITIDDGYLDTYTYAYPLLKEYGMRAVVFVLGDRNIRYNKWDEQKTLSRSSLMNKEQILEMYQNGFEIGAHTLSHPDLRTLTEKEAWEEINSSKRALKKELGIDPITFCYPHGGLNKRTKSLVKEAGFKYACSVYSGPAVIDKDPLEIRRIAVHNNVTELVMNLMVPQKLASGIKDALRKKENLELPPLIKNGESAQVLSSQHKVRVDFRHQ